MMAAESPLSLSPSPAREDLENLNDDEEEQTSTSSPFASRLISTARSELNGGDPLLNPPLSPSPPSSPGRSTGNVSSPPPSTLFTPQKIQNGVSERRGQEFTRISVTDPLKEIDPSPSLAGSSTFVSYLITAKSVNEGREYHVRRRFRDVVALADRLSESYRGYFIPARPDKSVVEGQVLQLSCSTQ
jgi:PX domain